MIIPTLAGCSQNHRRITSANPLPPCDPARETAIQLAPEPAVRDLLHASRDPQTMKLVVIDRL